MYLFFPNMINNNLINSLIRKPYQDKLLEYKYSKHHKPKPYFNIIVRDQEVTNDHIIYERKM